MVKMISIDLDGTLLNSEQKISQENKEAIQYAQKKGIEVIIATGRANFDVEHLFRDTGIHTWIIAANGATIHTPTGELYSGISIPKKCALDIMKWLESEDYFYEVISEQAIFSPQYGKELLNIEIDKIISANPDADIDPLREAVRTELGQFGLTHISSYSDLINQPIAFYNILAFSFNRKKIVSGMCKFEQYEGLALETSADHNFELIHKDVSKGLSLKKLAAELGIPLTDVVAIGDSYNDVSMLKIVGKSVAMGNAKEEIKALCDEVTLTNNANGVAHTIHRLI